MIQSGRSGVRQLVEEAVGEERDVGGAGAERREDDAGLGEAVEEVFAEAAGVDLGAEIAVGGGDEADVDGDGRGAADAGDGARLEDAEELGLEVERELADLVEEEGAAAARSKAPTWRASAPVKAPRSWPKSTLSASVRGEVGGVEHHEGPGAARRARRGGRGPAPPCRCRSRPGRGR